MPSQQADPPLFNPSLADLVQLFAFSQVNLILFSAFLSAPRGASAYLKAATPGYFLKIHDAGLIALSLLFFFSLNSVCVKYQYQCRTF